MRKTLTLALLLALLAPMLKAGTRTINYQGQLTDLADNTINAPQNMAFELYDAITGGSLINSWAATSVPVTRGLFNVELTLPTLTAAQLSGDLWLQVTVAGNVMSPRKRILYNVLAVSADSLQGMVPGSSGGNIPVILTSTGKLDPSILSAPFPLVVSGTGSAAVAAAGLFDNQDVGAGQVGIRAYGQDSGLTASMRNGNGVAVRGSTIDLVGDASAGIGVLGMATNGVGVRAQANAAGTTALQAINLNGLGSFSNGAIGALIGGNSLGLRIGGITTGLQTPSTPITGIEVNAIGKGIVINNSGSGGAMEANNYGNGVAIEGKANGSNSIALRGAHLGSGFGTGVWGQTDSVGGQGVHGEAGAGTGFGIGVDGLSGSLSGKGVRGSSPGIGVEGESTDTLSPTAATYGVEGRARGSNGRGVNGVADGNNLAYGIYGLAPNSLNGAGVYGSGLKLGVGGVASGSGGTVGVRGSAFDTGVEGVASGSSGAGSIGVHGSSASTDGIGVSGESLAAGNGQAIGVYGKAVAGQGIGVSGVGPAAGVRGVNSGSSGHGVEGIGGPAGSGLNRAGVHGSLNLANGEVGYGIYGTVNGTSGDGYAVYAYANQPNHRALRAYNNAAIQNQQGYALGIEGKLKIGTSNAGFFVGGSAASAWVVPCDYVGAGDLVLVTPAVDISSGGTVANALWVAPADVLDGSFTVRSAVPISGLRFNYLVIDKD